MVPLTSKIISQYIRGIKMIVDSINPIYATTRDGNNLETKKVINNKITEKKYGKSSK
jgi:hypothetical protein